MKKSIYLFTLFMGLLFLSASIMAVDDNFVMVTNALSRENTVTLGENTVMVLRLETPLAAGYNWSGQHALLKAVGQKVLPTATDLLGVPNEVEYYFIAQSKGAGELKMSLVRSWEKERQAAQTFTVAFKTIDSYTGNFCAPQEQLAAVVEYENCGDERALPSVFNWCGTNNADCPTVRNQGSTNACWSFCTVGAFECATKQTITNFSEQFLINCNKDGYSAASGGYPCSKYHYNTLATKQTSPGAVNESACGWTGSDGICNGPYPVVATLTTYGTVAGTGVATTDQLKNALYTYGPIACGVYANSGFQSYSGGVFSGSGTGACNHCVVLTGWNDTTGTWNMRNSWGTSWGENGYMRIKYGVNSIGGRSEYVQYTTVVDNPPVANFTYAQTSGTLTEVFTDTSTDDKGISARLWNFGDGTTSALQNPSHTYSAAATYTVSLKVTDTASQTNTKTASVVVTATSTNKEIFAASFTGSGVWTYDPNTSAWAQWNPNDSSLLAAGDINGNGTEDLAGVYGSLGLFIRYDSGTWSKVNVSGNPISLAIGDLDGNGTGEIIGEWTGIGVWSYNVSGNTWTKILSKDANQISAGDYDLDGKDEVLGWWSPEGLWIYHVDTTVWAKVLDETSLVQIATGDINGDKRDDVLGAWTHGVWYYNLATSAWSKLYTVAEKVAAGDLNGGGKDDLIGCWVNVAGVWAYYTETGTWYQIHPTKPACFAAGKLK